VLKDGDVIIMDALDVIVHLSQGDKP